MPPDENEPELKLALLDGEEESQYNKMMREITPSPQNILQERPSETKSPIRPPRISANANSSVSSSFTSA